MEIPAGVVDLHVHIQPWDQLRPEVRQALAANRADLQQVELFQAEPDAFAEHLQRCGVSRAGLVNYPAPGIMGFDASTNDFVARYRDRRPQTFLAWGGMDPLTVSDPDREMKRLLRDLRLDGIKVHPPHQGFAPNAYLDGMAGLRVLYEQCQEHDVPVMIHTGTSVFPGARSRLGDPMLCDDVAVDFPALRLILAHCGRPLWYEAAFFVARRHPNVLLELSGIPPSRIPTCLPRLQELGGKVVWGTDWPSPGVRDLRRNLLDFLGLPQFDERFKKAVLADNPARLFPPREG